MEVVTKKKAGRPPKDDALSTTDRVRRHRENKRVEGAAAHSATVKTRKQPSNSADAIITAMVNAAQPMHEPPASCPISPNANSFWNAILSSRARQDWTEPDLILAAQLAQIQADMQEEDRLMRGEGRVIVDYLGKTTKNPRFDVIEILSKRMLAMMRSLHLGSGSGARARDYVGARVLEADARQLREEVEKDDGLLA